VFFAVTGERGVHLFTIGTDGSDVTRITQGKEEHNSLPQWSADGSTIYYYQERPPASFRKISARGGESIELAPGWRWETHNGARVDPEGKRIIYSKLDKGLAAQTMIRDIETGKETAFTLPLLHPRWSSEGKFVVGVDVTSSKWPGDITICPADGGPCRKLTKGYAPQWSSDTSRIYFLRRGDLKDGGWELWSIYRAGGDERKVCDLRPDVHLINSYDVSPGGQIVWVQFRRGKNELWLSDLPNP
jgi:Tol biopolymer transport system component